MMTDIQRWENPENLRDEWAYRSLRAARFIPDGSTILDIGCGKMALERYLPRGCTYIPADLVARDERTILCDLNRQLYPDAGGVTLITALGVLEYVRDLKTFLAWLAAQRVRIICSYVGRALVPPIARREQLGWVNHLHARELIAMAEGVGLRFVRAERVQNNNAIFIFDPAA